MPGTDIALSGSQKRRDGRGPDDRRSMGEVILSKRNSGVKMFLIAAELGVSEVTCNAWMKLALDARIAPTVDEYRRQQNDALDERLLAMQAQLAMLDSAMTHRDDEGNPPSASMMLAIMSERRPTILAMAKIDERRAKLNGLDAPVRTDVTLTVQDGEDAELQEMLREAQAEQAAKGVKS